MNNIVNARKLLTKTVAWLNKALPNLVLVRFDDGVVQELSFQTVMLSRIAWEAYTEFPKVQITNKCLFLPEEPNADSKCITRISDSIIDAYRDMLYDPMFKETLEKAIFDIPVNLHNYVLVYLAEFSVDLSVEHFLELRQDKGLKKLLPNGHKPTQEEAVSMLDKIKDYILQSPTLDHNTIAITVRTNAIRMTPILQTCGFVGYLTNMNSRVYDEPIIANLIDGSPTLGSFYKMCDQAGIAYAVADNDLATCEWKTRVRQQLSAMLQTVHYVDCGSESYLDITLEDDLDVRQMNGKYFVNDKGSLEEFSSKRHKSLIGSTLKVRSFYAGCSHPDPNGVCQVCFGGIAFNLKQGGNVGIDLDSQLGAKIAGAMLGTKHSIVSASVDKALLGLDASKHLSIGDDGHSYKLSKNALANKDHLSLIISSGKIRWLERAIREENLHTIDRETMGSLDQIIFAYTNKKTGHISNTYIVDMVTQARKPILSLDFLRHIHKRGMSINDKGDYVIPMGGIDANAVLFELPIKTYGLSDLVTRISGLIESNLNKKSWRAVPENRFLLLEEMRTLVKERLGVINLTVLEATLYSVLGVDPIAENYSMPKNKDPLRGAGILTDIMFGRTLGAVMAWQHPHEYIFNNPTAFTLDGKTGSVMDAVWAPKEHIRVERIRNGIQAF